MSLPRPPCADFYCASSYRSEDSIGYRLKSIVGTMTQIIDADLEGHGLTHAQWQPLFMVHIGRASTVAELARICNSDAGAMTRLLDRLESKELLRRVRSTEDRRVVNVELTDGGRGVVQHVPEVLAHMQNQMLAGFSREEWDSLKNMLDRILANAEAVKEAAR